MFFLSLFTASTYVRKSTFLAAVDNRKDSAEDLLNILLLVQVFFWAELTCTCWIKSLL